jgi:ABC-type Fe3+-hydroxamate transport system substrate-binding protein
MKFIDQLNRSVELASFPPKKIISTVPSQTELLFDLGLEEEVIGITKFCVHPDNWFRNKKRIGGTKNLNIPLIQQLQPDLIVGNKEENEQSQMQELEKEYPVWISDIKNLEDAEDMIKRVGALVERTNESLELIKRIKTNFTHYLGHPSSAIEQLPSNSKPRTIYLIWKDPYMSVGGDTFIHDMMQYCGFHNMLEDDTRYPQLSEDGLKSMGCQLLLLSSEPFPFKQKHVDELQAILPETRVILVDGEMFSWYGSRLQHAPAYFSQLRELVFNR